VRRAVAVVVLLGLVAGAVALSRREAPRSPSPSPASPVPAGLPEGEWLGSDGCAACHGDEHARWAKTNHALTIRPFSPAVVPKELSGGVWWSRGIRHTIGPGGSMEVEGPGGTLQRFPVEWVIGLRRVQMFTTTFDRGRIQVLPVFLQVPRRQWIDYLSFSAQGIPKDFVVPPDSPNSWYAHSRNFNSRCGECHMTRYEVGYDADAAAYATTWSERVVGCESCHGPGAAHARHWMRRDEGPDPMLHPGLLPVDRANQSCAYCHAEREEVATGFRPGDDLFSFVDVLGLEDAKHLHPDGRARELIHNFVPILESRCGPIRCTECHDPHGRGAPGDLRRPLDDDATCLSCHEKFRGAIEAHTHHPAASAGSRCVACHMPPLPIEGGHGQVRDHTISIPSPRNRREHAVPDACFGCHLGEEPGWDRARFDEWYPGAEARNHRNALADTVALGRAGDPRAREALLALLEGPNPVYRAGATWMLKRYGVDLSAQLADPHPMVRRAAIDAAGRAQPEFLVPLLDDPNPVLRRAAVGALARNQHLEFLRGRGLVDRLLAVLAPFAAMRPDDAWIHATTGWLEEASGRAQAAARAYRRYLALRPWDEDVRARVARLEAGR